MVVKLVHNPSPRLDRKLGDLDTLTLGQIDTLEIWQIDEGNDYGDKPIDYKFTLTHGYLPVTLAHDFSAKKETITKSTILVNLIHDLSKLSFIVTHDI